MVSEEPLSLFRWIMWNIGWLQQWVFPSPYTVWTVNTTPGLTWKSTSSLHNLNVIYFSYKGFFWLLQTKSRAKWTPIQLDKLYFESSTLTPGQAFSENTCSRCQRQGQSTGPGYRPNCIMWISLQLQFCQIQRTFWICDSTQFLSSSFHYNVKWKTFFCSAKLFKYL